MSLARYVGAVALLLLIAFPIGDSSGQEALKIPNLTFFGRAGWDHPLVVRNIDDSSGSSCQLPIFLNVDPDPNYWNVSAASLGEAVPSFAMSFFVDGNLRGLATVPAQPPIPFYVVNEGPFYNLSGRHTCEVFLDSFSQIAESDETDNRWARQYIWRPHLIPQDTPVLREAPPSRGGGRSSIPSGDPDFDNCDGLRFDTVPGDFHAITVVPTDLSERYDAHLYPASVGVENGFDTPLVTSDPSAGELVALLVRDLFPGTEGPWDVGVTNYFGGSSDYVIEQVTNDPAMDYGDSVTINLAEGELIKLIPFHVGPGQTGPLYVNVEIDPGEPSIEAWLIADEAAIGLSGGYRTNEDGLARLFDWPTQFDWFCIVLFRNPEDPLPALAIGVEVGAALPDLMPGIPHNWYNPLIVTTEAAYGATGMDAPPDTLYGGVDTNFINCGVFNWSNLWLEELLLMQFFVDGVMVRETLHAPLFGPRSTWEYQAADSFGPVGGGRHCVSVHVDPNHAIPDLDPTNNTYGVQFCWSPEELPFGTPVTRPAPPDPTGGHWNLDRISPYNCDGVRLTTQNAPSGANNWWQAVSVASSEASDVDVRLFPLLQGTETGFRGFGLAYSTWPSPLPKFVLVNFRRTPYRAFDIGYFGDGGQEDFVTEHVSSTLLASDPDGTFGPYFLGPGRMLHLWEFQLYPGLYAFQLDAFSRGVDWGMALHRSDDSYASPQEHVSDGIAWQNGTGVGEWFTVDIATTGYYCLSVWKANSGQVNINGSYQLRIKPDVTDVPEIVELPARTALMSVHPNPFNPQTTVSFDLAADGDVRMQIFDLKGARVRSVLSEYRNAGRHRIPWDGCDDSGNRLASGTYVIQLRAGETTSTQKVVLVK